MQQPAYSSLQLLKKLEEDGWYVIRVRGSHQQLKHPFKKETVTVPHPKKDLPKKTVKSIFKQAGL